MLPLVRRIVGDLMRLHASIESQRAQLRGLANVEEISDRATYSEELRDVRASLAAEERDLQGCMAELAALGVEPHVPIDGGIDFPAKLNRRVVRLCWTPDDSEVSHWHEIGQPFSARRRLDLKVLSGESSGGRAR